MIDKHQDTLRRIANVEAFKILKETLCAAADYIDELETQHKMMNRIISSEAVPAESTDSRLLVIEHRITVLEQRLHSIPTILDIESYMMGSRRG